MKFEEKTLNKNYIYKGKILNLRRDDVVLPDGNTAIREIVEHSGGACVLVENEGKFLFVKQFRYAYGKEIYEIPAGKINLGEDTSVTAIRELEEECGYRAESVELMFKCYPSPGYTNEIIYIYKAKNITKTTTHLDEDEFLSCEWIDRETVKRMIASGELCDGKTLIALLSVL